MAAARRLWFLICKRIAASSDRVGRFGVLTVSVARSAPAVQIYHSPLRQHKRTPSHHREVKETLDARFEYTSDDLDGRSHHKINQYTIKEEIGRGSYGAVHLATDQYGHEYVGLRRPARDT